MWKAENRLHQEVQESEARADQVRIAELWIESREQHGAAVFQGELSTAASEARALRAELAAHVAEESRVASSAERSRREGQAGRGCDQCFEGGEPADQVPIAESEGCNSRWSPVGAENSEAVFQ